MAIQNQKVCSRRVSVWWYVHAAMAMAIVSVNFSTAMYSPAENPQYTNWNTSQQYQQEQQQQQHHVQWEDPARGGSTMMARPPAEAEIYPEEQYEPPKILLKHMSMALRVTSEWNRRLLNGVNCFKFWKRKADATTDTAENDQMSSVYGAVPVNVHPSRAWKPPIRAAPLKSEDDDLTIFHARTPRRDAPGEAPPRGVARWGPELLPYLEHIVDLLGIASGGVEIPLAMIYLDRACSVETHRTNGVPPCPFCTPRTVHRLSLASLLLATQAVNGWTEAEMLAQFEKVAFLGIPEAQLQQMVDWMRGALGDTGLMVTVPQMQEWGRNWESIFSPRSRQDQLEQQALSAARLEIGTPRYY